MPSRRRPTSVAAAAPNSSSIGGPGTSVPPELVVLVDVMSVPLLDDEELVEVELDVDELVELDDEDPVEVEVAPPVVEVEVEVAPPEVDVEVEVELELELELELEVDVEVEVEVEVEPPPVDEVEPPVEVDPPPVEVVEPPVEVDAPPVEVEVAPPLVVEEPPVEVKVPPVDVTPPVVVVDTETLPPPPKNPPKNPPPKPKPPEPPITVTSLPPPCGEGCGGIGGSGICMGTMASICCSGWAQGTVRLTTRRAVFGSCSLQVAVRITRRFNALGFVRATGLALACLTYWTWLAGASAICTAPPPITAPPAASADNFTSAIRTDISSALFAFSRD